MTGGKTDWLRLFSVLPPIISFFFGQRQVGGAGKEIRIAAAADLKVAMGELAEEFEKQQGAKVSVSYGSSGNFFSQLQHGAPFDLFFSADIEYPKKLDAAGLAEPGTLYEYAIGRIVIWTTENATVDVQNHGWKTVLNAGVHTIGIWIPVHAPYVLADVEMHE